MVSSAYSSQSGSSEAFWRHNNISVAPLTKSAWYGGGPDVTSFDKEEQQFEEPDEKSEAGDDNGGRFGFLPAKEPE
jgi:hypothetical protein